MHIHFAKVSYLLGIGFFGLGPLAAPPAQAAVRALCCTPLEQINTHLELLTLYLKQGDTAAAQQALFNAQTLLQLHFPTVASQPAHWAQVASAHSALAQFEPAFAIYERLYRARPDASYALRLGQLALQLDQGELASHWLTVAHRLFPADAFPPVLALNLWESKRYPAAALRLEALQTNPVLRDALSASAQADNRLRLADIYLRQDTPTKARALLLRTPLDLVSPGLKPVLASVYMRLARFDEAATLYEELLRAAPQHPSYLLALANALSQQTPQADSQRIQALFRQGFDLSVVPSDSTNDTLNERKDDDFWRSLFFGLSRYGEFRRAEQAFLRLTQPTVTDVLQAAFLAQRRGQTQLAQARFRQVVQRLPLRPGTAQALRQRWQAEWALLQDVGQSLQDPTAFRQHQAEASRRWQAVFGQSLLQSTAEGRLLLIESALALGTPGVLSQAETLLNMPADDWDNEASSASATWQLRQAELELRQRPAAAPVRFEQLFQRLRPLSAAERADLARGLTAVQKNRAAEQVWESLLDAPETLQPQDPQSIVQWQLERLHNRLQSVPLDQAKVQAVRQSLTEHMQQWPEEAATLTLLRRAQLAFSLRDYALARADFSQVLAIWPGNLTARQGLALSLLGLQRYRLAHEAFLVLQDWCPPEGELYRDASLRLAQIEQIWGYRALPLQRAELLQQSQQFPSTDAIALAAQQLQVELFSKQWPTPLGYMPHMPYTPLYTGELSGGFQDFFIGNTYTRYGLFNTGHTLSWIHPQETPPGALTPALQQQLTLEATRYQRLGESDAFSFQRGGLRWAQHWRHESPTGPLHYWWKPAVAYRWGIPEPFTIGVNQHGHAELETGVQLDRHQALQWEGDLKFGQAELFLGSFYNYGSAFRWRWSESLIDPWGHEAGVWGAALVVGVQNYLVLDGSGTQQNLFRQINGIDMRYEDSAWEYTGHFDVSPIYGTLSDINFNTRHALKQELNAEWALEYQIEAHHYQQPIQRFQNQWRAQGGMVYHFQMPLQNPLSLAVGIGLNHFYSTGFVPAPQIYFSLRTRR